MQEWMRTGLLVEETIKDSNRKDVTILTINWNATGIED